MPGPDLLLEHRQVEPETVGERVGRERKPCRLERVDRVEPLDVRPDLAFALRIFLTFRAKNREGSPFAVLDRFGVARLLEQLGDLGLQVYSSKGASSSASRETPVDSKAAIATAHTTSGAFFTSCSFQSSR